MKQLIQRLTGATTIRAFHGGKLKSISCAVLFSIALAATTQAAAAGYDVRGKTKAQIKAIYGKPVSIKGPVGGFNAKRPPITEWQYDDFFVTFENNIALHGFGKDSLKLELNR